MQAGEKYCFIDASRPCDRACKAFDEKTGDCKIVRSLSGVSSNLASWTRWLQHHDPPKPG